MNAIHNPRIVYEPFFFSLENGAAANKILRPLAPWIFIIDPCKPLAKSLVEAAHYFDPDFFVQNLMRRASKSPDVMMALREICHSQTGKDVSTAPPRQLERTLSEILHNTKKIAIKDPEFLIQKKAIKKLEHPNNPDFLARRKERIQLVRQALRLLPSYVKSAIEHEPLSIIIHDQLIMQPHSQKVRLASTNDGGSWVALNMSSHLDLTPKMIMGYLKEEMLHHFDFKSGFSQKESFRKAVDHLLSDSLRVQVIDKLSSERWVQPVTGINAEGQVEMQNYRKEVSQYNPEDRYQEMLVEYFHMRDQLRENMAANQGVAAKITKRHEKEEYVSQQMKLAFGNELDQLCREFEQSLPGQASEVSKSPRIHSGRRNIRR